MKLGYVHIDNNIYLDQLNFQGQWSYFFSQFVTK